MTDSQKHFIQDYSPTLEKNKLFNKIIKEFFNKDFIYIYIYICMYVCIKCPKHIPSLTNNLEQAKKFQICKNILGVKNRVASSQNFGNQDM